MMHRVVGCGLAVLVAASCERAGPRSQPGPGDDAGGRPAPHVAAVPAPAGTCHPVTETSGREWTRARLSVCVAERGDRAEIAVYRAGEPRPLWTTEGDALEATYVSMDNSTQPPVIAVVVLEVVGKPDPDDPDAPDDSHYRDRSWLIELELDGDRLVEIGRRIDSGD